MAFSEDIKREFIEEIPHKTCCRRALAYGLLFDAFCEGDRIYIDTQSAEHAEPLFSTEVWNHDRTRAEIAQGKSEAAWLWYGCDEKRQGLSRLRCRCVQQKDTLYVLRSKAVSQVFVPDLSGAAQKLRVLRAGRLRTGKLLPELRCETA